MQNAGRADDEEHAVLRKGGEEVDKTDDPELGATEAGGGDEHEGQNTVADGVVANCEPDGHVRGRARVPEAQKPGNRTGYR